MVCFRVGTSREGVVLGIVSSDANKEIQVCYLATTETRRNRDQRDLWLVDSLGYVCTFDGVQCQLLLCANVVGQCLYHFESVSASYVSWVFILAR